MSVALVTGGSRGIGRAAALALAAAGWDVALSWKDREDAAQSVVAAIRDMGRESLALPLDLGKRDSARGAVKVVDRELGRLDLLVNNAGMLVQKPWLTITDGEWDQMFAVNVRGVFQMCQESFPALKQSSGSIVNISSIGGQTGGALAMHYSATKAALISMTRSLARVGAPNVRVNAIAPGLIDTEMTAAERAGEGAAAKLQSILAGRVGTPEEVAAVVVFLASPAASYITGQIIGVNGGAYFG